MICARSAPISLRRGPLAAVAALLGGLLAILVLYVFLRDFRIYPHNIGAELLIETGDQPLTVEGIGLLETRYPLEMESRFSSSDPRLDAVVPVALRGLQMCAHETYMDCPYYEQMMYVGDTRLEALTTYAISSDERLPRKAIKLFELSRLPQGFTQARYPGRDQQLIPPFALWWIGMAASM